MKAAITSILPLIITPAFAGFHDWKPPGKNDVRAPCPMLNTLANHGFLPHHGKHLTRQQVIDGLYNGLNINKTTGDTLFNFALMASPEPNATTVSLDDLGRHNILEHDASLSRTDAYFGDVLKFNKTVFAETKQHWGHGKILDVAAAARARLGRIITSKATNPEYTMSELGDAFTYGESVAYIMVLGDINTGKAKRRWVEYWFENERLPTHLGWKKPSQAITAEHLDIYMERIRNITLTLPGGTDPVKRRAASHFGW
ncbi:hypothetical protein VTJ83DRAFT_778 [Remersonia thermophila]|uniref:Heme haloperoxidase family profile domain-containing protein n=1 Tax=Remersonia thermophila TaxID=72144 RepID=A0ABR4DME1_9PEZI